MTRRATSVPTITDKRVGPLPLLVVFAIPLWLMGKQLMLPLWFDEAYTLGTFASRPISEIVTDYSEPNNHVGFSLLMHLLSDFPPEPFIHRLPSLLCGLGTLWLVFVLARSVLDDTSAVLSVALLGTNQVYLNFATQVRGYSLSMLLFMLLVHLTLPSTQANLKRAVAVILVGAFFVYVIPTNLFFVISLGAANSFIAAWRTGLRSRSTTTTAVIHMCSAGLGCLLYLPVAGQLQQAAAGSSFEVADLMRVAGGFFSSILVDVPTRVAALGLPVLAYACLKNLKGPASPLSQFFFLAATAAVAPVVMAGVCRVVPFERNFLPALPLVVTAIACGCSLVLRKCCQLFHSDWVSLAACVLLVAGQVKANLSFPDRLERARLSGAPETPYFLYTAASFDPGALVDFISESARRRECYACVMTDRAWQNLGYEFTSFNLPRQISRTVNDEPFVDVVYVVSMSPPDTSTLERATGLSADLIDSAQPDGVIGGFIVSTIRRPLRLPAKMRLGGND